MANKRILITGACGFAGSHMVEYFFKHTTWDILVLDRLTYAGHLDRLAAYRQSPRVKFIFHDFRAEFSDHVLDQLYPLDYVIHNGAESHVATSLKEPRRFVEANVLGTLNVLEAALVHNVKRFLYTSTDEVHGATPPGVQFSEDAPIRPSNPYSAAKAGGEALVHAYWRSYGLPVTITRCQNLFGERQHPEKFIPLCIGKILKGEVVPIHGDSEGNSGSRMWVHARNESDAIHFLLNHEQAVGETFHIVGEERSNLGIAQCIASVLGRELKYEIVDIRKTIPGHDLRYSLSQSKLNGLGWNQPVNFEDSLRNTIAWYDRNREYLG